MPARITTASGRHPRDIGLRVLELFRARAEVAADHAAAALETKMKKVVSQRGTGRRYKRGLKTHVASAPGEPPARDTGDLARKIGFRSIGPAQRRIGAGTIVGLWMDRGTRRVAKRPWVWPSVVAGKEAVKIAARQAMRAGT